MIELILEKPMKIIEYILGVFLVARGLYFIYTFFARAEDSLLIDALGYPGVVMATGIAMIIPGAILIWANITERLKLKEISLFFAIILFTYLSTLNAMSTFPRPFMWVYPLVLAGIAAVAWLHSKTKRTYREQDKVYLQRGRETNWPSGPSR